MFTKFKYSSDNFYGILRQENNFEWISEHQKRFYWIKNLQTEETWDKIRNPYQPFYARCNGSNFGIGAALVQSHKGTNKTNLNWANSRRFTQAELRLSTPRGDYTAIVYTLTDYEIWILASNIQQFHSQIRNHHFFYLHKDQI